MPNIRIDSTVPIINGQTITFRSPADCSQVTGLIVYYPEGNGTTSKTFQFADAHGNNVGNIHLFAENVLVKVILDTDMGRAYVQNADTNAYLEGQLADKLSKTGGTMTGPVVAQNNENYAAKQVRNIFLVAEGEDLPSGSNGDICLVYTP